MTRPSPTLTTTPPGTVPGGALLLGAGAMALVGGSVAVSGVLHDAPLHTVQALRYALACALLVGVARWRGRQLVLPRGAEWWWLAGVVTTGLVLFNIGLVQGSAHAEPAVLAVAVASVPILLALLGPALARRRPSLRVVLAAVVVTCGAAVVHGLGRSDAVGLMWALVVMASEAGFTLLAVPVLRRHGALGVSVWTTALAIPAFGVLALVTEGPTAVRRLEVDHLLAGAYLAVFVTALAFVLWYACVGRIGAARAGLLTGVAPVGAALIGAALGAGVPSAGVWVGLVVVGTGLAIGLGRSRGGVKGSPDR
jgi:drug/metabolite transporter (DMT)-like permease